jgi:DNA-binding transcriptional regulator GbsR (MarR family)
MNTMLRDYFTKLGLSDEVADIYIALHIYGPQSISELARQSGVERTRIYRLASELRESNLVEIETLYKRQIFHAAPIANVQILIAKKEQEIYDLQSHLAHIQKVLAPSEFSSPATRIQTYQGIEGVKQMHWNQTKSKTENLSILYENMQTKTNLAFFERWMHKCNERDMQFRSIVGDSFITSQNNWYSRHANERLRLWEGRYMAPHTFPITYSTVIYDDVTSYFNWQDGKIFGIEIYNQQMADSQRIFFEMLWKQAVPLDEELKHQEKSRKSQQEPTRGAN